MSSVWPLDLFLRLLFLVCIFVKYSLVRKENLLIVNFHAWFDYKYSQMYFLMINSPETIPTLHEAE